MLSIDCPLRVEHLARWIQFRCSIWVHYWVPFVVKTSYIEARLIHFRFETSLWAKFFQFRLTRRVVNSVEFPSWVLSFGLDNRWLLHTVATYDWRSIDFPFDVDKLRTPVGRGHRKINDIACPKLVLSRTASYYMNLGVHFQLFNHAVVYLILSFSLTVRLDHLWMFSF